MRNLTQEEELKVNLLAGSFMAGLLRGTGMALKFSGTALKTSTSVTSAVLTKTANVIQSTGNVGGEILIGLGEKANSKADEYDDAVKLCQKILCNGRTQINEIAA